MTDPKTVTVQERLFVAKHSQFTLRPRLCRWPGRGWSLWWLWFEVAFIKGGWNVG